MVRNKIVILISTLLFIGCQEAMPDNKQYGFVTDSCMSSGIEEVSINQQWGCFLNNGLLDSLSFIYSPDAVKVEDSGNVISSRGNILGFYESNLANIDRIRTIKGVTAGPSKNYEYEIGSFSTTDNKLFKQLLIWNISKDEKVREFEFIAESKETNSVPTRIDQRRARWIALCNLNNAHNLVTELYASNAVYFNHRPALVGIDAIIEDYQYMNNPDYQLSLKPIIVEVVNESLVFEIGQCVGTYGGKYILIWQKDQSNDWKILVDSNI